MVGDLGPDEKLVGVAFGEVDSTNPRNAVITDIDVASSNDHDMVEYATDIYMLSPVDAALPEIATSTIHRREIKKK